LNKAERNPDVVVDALWAQAALLEHSYEVDDVLVSDRVERLIRKEGNEVDA
jgi:hypothetical protein